MAHRFPDPPPSLRRSPSDPAPASAVGGQSADDTKPAIPTFTPDRKAAIVALVCTVLGNLGLPDLVGLSAGQFAAALGFAMAIASAFRAWWEGREHRQGGSVVDPIGAVAGALVGLLGLFQVPEALRMTADDVVMLVSLLFAGAASLRDYIRRRLAQR